MVTGLPLMAQIPVYLDETKPLEERVDDALSRMTEAEKNELAQTCIDLRSSGVPRLGIPPFVVDTLTTPWFPSFEALAATWNPKLSKELGIGMAEQALYHRTDVVDDHAVNEMSKDAYLVSKMAPPYLEGIHQCGEAALQDWKALSVMETDSQDDLLREALKLYFKTSMNTQRPRGFVGSETQQSLAKTVAEESIVLLKNESLPLSKGDACLIWIVGNHPVEGLETALAHRHIQSEIRCGTLEEIYKASIGEILVFIGNYSDCNHTDFFWRFPAILQMDDLGAEGAEALAAILTGEVNPSGKLPCEWKGKEEKEPLFALGHGLSYTSFEFTDFQLSGREIPIGGDLIATVTVTNTGDREGYEVVQLYIHDIKSSVPKPDKELKGFQKIWLKPGESQEVQFVINESSLMFYDESLQQWWAEPGFYVAFVGDAMDRLPLKARFHLK